MKYDCEVIQDLLPLYKDSACSAASAFAVQEHLKECEKCNKIYESLNDSAIDELILKEKESVIDSQSKYFKRKSAVAGSVIAGIFALPILICLIVNLVSGHGLSWFFIVLAGMLIPASLFVVPLMATKNRMFLAMTSLTASIILLLAVCCIYSGGNWFFVAAPSVLFGLTVFFSPFIACRRPVNAYLGKCKGLAVMAADTSTFFLMMICIGLHLSESGYFRLMFSICIPLVLMAWAVFLIIRYLPANGIVKTGVCIMALSAFSYLGTNLILWLTVKGVQGNAVQIYSEPSLSLALVAICVGMAITVIGLLFGKNKKKN